MGGAPTAERTGKIVASRSVAFIDLTDVAMPPVGIENNDSFTRHDRIWERGGE